MEKQKKMNKLKKTLKYGIASFAILAGCSGLLTGCINGKDGANGTTWHSGTSIPTPSITATIGDFYLNEETFDLYKLTNNGWILIGNIKGDSVDNPISINQDGYWVINGEVTDVKAEGVDGKDGTTPTISINNEGYWVINGTTTNIKAVAKDGTTPTIEINTDGYWVINGAVTDVKAEGVNGKDGKTPTIEINDEGYWVINGQVSSIKAKATDGEDGHTPYVGDNNNWWINGEDTGHLAVGTNGTTPSLYIDEDGYWVINDIPTNYKAKCSAEDIYTQLSGIMELSTEGTPVVNYEPFHATTDNNWHHTNLAISGWGGCIGNPQEFDTLWFTVKPRSENMTKIKMYLFQDNKDGELLHSEELTVDIPAGEQREITWKLPRKIVNQNDCNYFFAYLTDAIVNGYGQTDYVSAIPSDKEQISQIYFTGKNINSAISTGQGATIYYYMYVKTGITTQKFVFKEDVLQELLEKMNFMNFKNNSICLPSKLYGYVGQTLQIYFENIINYPIDNVHIRVVSSNKGNIYSDRWEYTPESAETFQLKVQIYSIDYDLIQQSTFNVEIKDTTTQNQATVLVIGDSTVNAGVETSKMLELDETDENFSLTLLGTRGSDETNQHEGRGGWTADMFVNKASNNAGTVTNPFYNPETQKFDFTYYMTNQSYSNVDVVYLQLGINDMFAPKSDADIETYLNTYLTNMDFMINSIKEYNPDIKIVINPIIPCQPDQDKFTSIYGVSQTVWGFRKNMHIANNALISKYTNTDNVYISWYNASIDSQTNLQDDVHPTTDGYKQLGEQMYWFLKSIV